MSVRELDAYRTSRTRDKIAYLILLSTMMAMAAPVGSGSYGRFGAVKNVQAVVGPFVGGVVGYYFHHGQKAWQ